MERPSVSELINSKKFIIPFIASWFVFVIIFTIIGICIIFGGLLGLMAFIEGIPSDYAKASGWDCDQATFETEYIEKYMEKIEELEKKYDLNFEKEFKKSDNMIEETDYMIRLYGEEYYIYFDFEIFDRFAIFYAGISLNSSPSQPLEESTIELTLNFLNDLVHFAGYDTKPDKNNFELLYEKLIENGSEYESYIYKDSVESMVNVGYRARKYSEDFKEYWFHFEGLLKPLE